MFSYCQNWLNYLMDDHHFNYFTKLEKISYSQLNNNNNRKFPYNHHVKPSKLTCCGWLLTKHGFHPCEEWSKFMGLLGKTTLQNKCSIAWRWSWEREVKIQNYVYFMAIWYLFFSLGNLMTHDFETLQGFFSFYEGA